jgi:hypothetical protein
MYTLCTKVCTRRTRPCGLCRAPEPGIAFPAVTGHRRLRPHDRRLLPMTLCLDPKHAEAAVVVVERDALYDAGDFLGRGSALWDRGVHLVGWESFCHGRWGSVIHWEADLRDLAAGRGWGRSGSATSIVTRRTVRHGRTCYRRAAIHRVSSPRMEVLMLGHERRSKVLAKLTKARCELEEALNLSIPAARHDPVVIPEPLRNKLSAMIDDLKGVLRQIEGSQ